MLSNRPLSAADLHAHAKSYRLEAALLTKTLTRLRPSAVLATRLKISRYRSLASDLERAAERRAEVEA